MITSWYITVLSQTLHNIWDHFKIIYILFPMSSHFLHSNLYKILCTAWSHFEQKIFTKNIYHSRLSFSIIFVCCTSDSERLQSLISLIIDMHTFTLRWLAMYSKFFSLVLNSSNHLENTIAFGICNKLLVELLCCLN